MPQGVALSPDESAVAVVDSGVAPAALQIYDASNLSARARIPLKDAFGRPVWLDASHVLVAGANTHALLDVDIANSTIRKIVAGAAALPVAVALGPDKTTFGLCDDASGSVVLGSLGGTAAPVRIHVGDHPSDVAFSPDGKTLYAAVRQPSAVAVVDVETHAVTATIRVGLHPSALALSSDGTQLYVAESDDDSVGIVDLHAQKRTGGVSVELQAPRTSGYGASPNALLVAGAAVFVSLGAENAVGVIRNGALAERIPAGWYPTGVAVASDGTLFVANGRGERAPANPQFNPRARNPAGYVGLITVGSLRKIPPSAYQDADAETRAVVGDAAPQWNIPAQTVVRSGGPIEHVIYIIKENRSYDQVLGDVSGADGDASLTIYGARVTPNQHALSKRFGIFDNAYVDAQVSANGHNWTDAAFANDYVERFWPPNYGGRRDLYDFQQGTSPDVPHNGYLWDAAKRANITYRDYGEDVDEADNSKLKRVLNTFPGLAGHFDPHYIGWDLSYMDTARYAEWDREFRHFVAGNDLPQLEIVYLPNDHTSGTALNMRTPQAYLAMNDWAVGRLVDTVSHSKYWKSTAIFVLEDDAQDGPDHVSDQRSTFYIASPYAKGGIQHRHYSTAAFVHTIEILLGVRPLSIYDQTAQPLYAAFTMHPSNAAPFDALKPEVSIDELNKKTAYGSAISAKMNFSRPDAVDPAVLNDILAHAAQTR